MHSRPARHQRYYVLGALDEGKQLQLRLPNGVLRVHGILDHFSADGRVAALDPVSVNGVCERTEPTAEFVLSAVVGVRSVEAAIHDLRRDGTAASAYPVRINRILFLCAAVLSV